MRRGGGNSCECERSTNSWAKRKRRCERRRLENETSVCVGRRLRGSFFRLCIPRVRPHSLHHGAHHRHAFSAANRSGVVPYLVATRPVMPLRGAGFARDRSAHARCAWRTGLSVAHVGRAGGGRKERVRTSLSMSSETALRAARHSLCCAVAQRSAVSCGDPVRSRAEKKTHRGQELLRQGRQPCARDGARKRPQGVDPVEELVLFLLRQVLVIDAGECRLCVAEHVPRSRLRPERRLEHVVDGVELEGSGAGSHAVTLN